ncbi:MAG: hypothetical protein HGN29_07190 [Asgard group archaeon]|nr:hypothetical protein [Asgard group archaeon]
MRKFFSFKRWKNQKKIKKRKKKGTNQIELDEEFRKRMKEAYEQGLKQVANIGKVL